MRLLPLSRSFSCNRIRFLNLLDTLTPLFYNSDPFKIWHGNQAKEL